MMVLLFSSDHAIEQKCHQIVILQNTPILKKKIAQNFHKH